MAETPRLLPTTPLLEVTTPDVEQITSAKALPLFTGYLHAAVGPSEVGKSTLAAHAVLDVSSSGHPVLVLDGEMSAGAWRRKLVQLGAEDADLARIHYAEMSDSAAAVERVRATVATLAARLIVWDSALSLISRTAQSENDNAQVGRVFDRLRDIVRDGPAGLIVDHSANGSTALVSRGASAKFAALDVSYGVRLAEGSIPGPLDQWDSIVSVEKDRHGLLGRRADRAVSFIPLSGGWLAVDIVEVNASTHRLSATNPVAAMVAKIDELDPAPKSANDAYKRVGGTRTTVLAAYKLWRSQSGSGGSVSIETNHRTTSSEPVRPTEPPERHIPPAVHDENTGFKWSAQGGTASGSRSQFPNGNHLRLAEEPP